MDTTCTRLTKKNPSWENWFKTALFSGTACILHVGPYNHQSSSFIQYYDTSLPVIAHCVLCKFYHNLAKQCVISFKWWIPVINSQELQQI
jgi:hypothetical protein